MKKTQKGTQYSEQGNEFVTADAEVIVVYHALNAHHTRHKGTTVPGKSMTVPDMALTPAQLLERHQAGLPIDGVRIPLFEEEGEESNGINPAKLDLVEIEDLIRDNAEKIEKLQTKLKNDRIAANELRKKQELEKREALLKEFAESQQKSTNTP